jgi:hypothetical protein
VAWGASVLVPLLNVFGFGDGFRRFAVLWLRSSQHFALRGQPINGFVVYVCVSTYSNSFCLVLVLVQGTSIDIIEIRSPPFFLLTKQNLLIKTDDEAFTIFMLIGLLITIFR